MKDAGAEADVAGGGGRGRRKRVPGPGEKEPAFGHLVPSLPRFSLSPCGRDRLRGLLSVPRRARTSTAFRWYQQLRSYLSMLVTALPPGSSRRLPEKTKRQDCQLEPPLREAGLHSARPGPFLGAALPAAAQRARGAPWAAVTIVVAP